MSRGEVLPNTSASRRTRLRGAAVAASVVAATGVLAAVAVAGGGGVTGYPNKIATVDLSGYKVQTSYPLGADVGNTYDQTYASGTVSAVGVKGPGKGTQFSSKYVAMPVGHEQLMISWYKANGTLTDVFVMNFATGTVSDVRPAANPPSLGSVQLLTRGSHAIP
jgi:hypothetical protein